MRAIISMAAFCVLIASPAKAIRPDECEQQRATYFKNSSFHTFSHLGASSAHLIGSTITYL
jgi:hypothetical protein